MLNEIDVDGLRACLQFGGFPGCNLCNGEGCFNVDYGDGRDVCPYCKERRDAALPALLDEVERLRGERSNLVAEEMAERAAANRSVAEKQYRRAEAAEAERDALKERLERVRQFADNILVKPEYPLGTVGQFRQDGEVGIARCVLAIIEGKDQ